MLVVSDPLTYFKGALYNGFFEVFGFEKEDGKRVRPEGKKGPRGPLAYEAMM